MKLVKNIKKMVLQQKLFLYKGAYIKYVGGGGGGGFYKFFKKFFVAQETIDLNISWPSNFFGKISWPLLSILVSHLRLSCSSISGKYSQ